MKRHILPLFLLTFLSIIVLGCGPISSLDIDRDGATIDVVLKESQVDKILKRADLTLEDEEGSILDEITGVNFQEGYIEVLGLYTDDSGATREGSLDIEIGATDGMLDVAIKNVEIENVDPADIEKVNRELAAEFASEAQNGDVEFREVVVTSSKLTMQVAVRF
mgnify:CR=1 FL=1